VCFSGRKRSWLWEPAWKPSPQSRPERIAARVEKGQDALLLVVVQPEPAERHEAGQDDDRGLDDRGLEAPVEDHAAQKQEQAQARAQVGLDDDQGRGYEPDAEDDEQPAPVEVAGVAREGLGAQEEHRDLGQLARLEIEQAEIDPALGSAGDVPVDQDHQKERHGDPEERPGQELQVAVVEEHEGEHAAEADEPPDELLLIEGGDADALLDADAAGRVEVE
jgi:hypothetical protein